MKYALFPGCTVQTEQYGYELSAREVLPKLGVELVELEGANCCGFPYFSISSPLGWKYLSARNLALAEALGLDIITLCNGCHLSFCDVQRDLKRDGVFRDLINKTLSMEGLEYGGKSKVVHLIEALYDTVGIKKLAKNVVKPLKNLRVAAHPGCHAFRPKELDRPEDSEDPQKLEGLIRALGAEAPNYFEKKDCCGSYPYISEEKAALLIAGSKLKAVGKRGYDALVTVCPHCSKILDGKQQDMRNLPGYESVSLPVVYYTQLLGLAMGIQPELLGTHLNLSPVDKLLERVK